MNAFLRGTLTKVVQLPTLLDLILVIFNRNYMFVNQLDSAFVFFHIQLCSVVFYVDSFVIRHIIVNSKCFLIQCIERL